MTSAPSRQPALDDAELVAAAATGDPRAFDELYQRHVDSVWRRLRRLVGPHTDCEDLVQQTFLAVYRALPRFRGDAAFTTFLYRIVVRIASDHLRRARRSAARTVAVTDLDDFVASGAGPDEAMHTREGLARAFTMLAKIKPKKRIAWVLRVVEGLSLEQIADLVDANAAAVGQRVKYAQRELDALLEREVKR